MSLNAKRKLEKVLSSKVQPEKPLACSSTLASLPCLLTIGEIRYSSVGGMLSPSFPSPKIPEHKWRPCLVCHSPCCLNCPTEAYLPFFRVTVLNLADLSVKMIYALWKEARERKTNSKKRSWVSHVDPCRDIKGTLKADEEKELWSHPELTYIALQPYCTFKKIFLNIWNIVSSSHFGCFTTLVWTG